MVVELGILKAFSDGNQSGKMCFGSSWASVLSIIHGDDNDKDDRKSQD